MDGQDDARPATFRNRSSSVSRLYRDRAPAWRSPLEDAFRIAYKELVLWLVAEYGMDALDAYELCSQAGEVDAAQVVDPNYTIVAKIRKSYLPSGEVMKGAHRRLESGR